MTALSAFDLRSPRTDVRTVHVSGFDFRDDAARGTVDIGGHRTELVLSSPTSPVRASADAFLALTLVPALMLGADLDVDGPVAPSTIAAAHRVQAQFARWFSSLRPVAIRAARREERPRAAGMSAMFSGGVDSWHTLLRHRARLSHALLVHGFDLQRHERRVPSPVVAALRGAVAEAGVTLLEIETNARRWSFEIASVLGFLDRYFVWSFAHGAAIAGFNFALADAVGGVVIPSSDSGETLVPWGSHPDLDPQWTGPEVAFEHDEATTTRFEKLEALAAFDPAVRNLRVCWASAPDGKNCGRCEKCLRTMATLHALGAADRAVTFPPITARAIAAARISMGSVGYWRDVERGAERLGDRGTANAVRAALARRGRRAFFEGIRTRAAAIPGVGRLRARLREGARPRA
jgi:hypothetical protein